MKKEKIIRRLNSFDHRAVISAAAGYCCLADRDMLLEFLSFMAGKIIDASKMGGYVTQVGEWMRQNCPPFNNDKFLVMYGKLDRDSSAIRTDARWKTVCDAFMERAMLIRLGVTRVTAGTCPYTAEDQDDVGSTSDSCDCRKLVDSSLVAYKPGIPSHGNACNATRTLRDMGAVAAG